MNLILIKSGSIPKNWKDGFKKAINNYNNEKKKETLNYNININLHRYKNSGMKQNTAQNNINVEKFMKEKEKEGDIVFPTSNHMHNYENKLALLDLFKKSGVKIPPTWYFNKLEDAINSINIIEFPIIIKQPYSCYSKGIMQCLSKDDYYKTITNFFKTSKECIIQKKINFTREARLTYVGYNLFHGYYRIKKNPEQMSGCSRFGSICSFDIDLKKNAKIIESFVNKTGFDIGGLDIVWEDDDETKEPYILEVSPIFDVNPPPPYGWKDSYKKFKLTEEHNEEKNKVIAKVCQHITTYVIDKYSKPVIYCDIDSTINNHEIRIKRWYNGSKIDPKAFTYDEIMKDLPIKDSIESNHKLYKHYRIYFITARKKFPNAYNSTRDWLNKYQFRYDRIILTNSLEDKIKYLKKETDLKAFIDDCTINHQAIVKENHKAINKLRNDYIPLIIFKNNWIDIVNKIFDN